MKSEMQILRFYLFGRIWHDTRAHTEYSTHKNNAQDLTQATGGECIFIVYTVWFKINLRLLKVTFFANGIYMNLFEDIYKP